MCLDLECLALLLCLLILRSGVIGTEEIDLKRLRERSFLRQIIELPP